MKLVEDDKMSSGRFIEELTKIMSLRTTTEFEAGRVAAFELIQQWIKMGPRFGSNDMLVGVLKETIEEEIKNSKEIITKTHVESADLALGMRDEVQKLRKE